jgi:hypothetical protein
MILRAAVATRTFNPLMKLKEFELLCSDLNCNYGNDHHIHASSDFNVQN